MKYLTLIIGLIGATLLNGFVTGPCDRKWDAKELAEKSECEPKCYPNFRLGKSKTGECICDMSRKKVK